MDFTLGSDDVVVVVVDECFVSLLLFLLLSLLLSGGLLVGREEALLVGGCCLSRFPVDFALESCERDFNKNWSLCCSLSPSGLFFVAMCLNANCVVGCVMCDV